jgi:hypothetical protein
MTRLAATIAVAAALLAPSSAAAGGWATVGLDPLPDGVGPNKPWQVELTILQHGRTPLQGVKPRVTITRAGARKAFPARSTGEPGVYSAEVVFPSAGTWRYAVDDGFTRTHTFPPVDVRAGGGGKAPVGGDAARSEPGPGVSGDRAAGAATGDGGGSDIPLGLAIAAVLGLTAAFGAVMLRRRRPYQAPG